MALGDGIARNKGYKGYAFQKGYKAGLDDFLKVISKEFGADNEVVIEQYDLRKIAEKLKVNLP